MPGVGWPGFEASGCGGQHPPRSTGVSAAGDLGAWPVAHPLRGHGGGGRGCGGTAAGQHLRASM